MSLLDDSATQQVFDEHTLDLRHCIDHALRNTLSILLTYLGIRIDDFIDKFAECLLEGTVALQIIKTPLVCERRAAD